ncbi:MAG: OadG family protein [Lachnospiraceae bacterium]|nr:OadG family protein [Lachnospiraceae bacterium]
MKKIIKRPVLLFAALLLVLSMTACGSAAKGGSDFDTDSADKATKNTIAIMQHASDLGIDHLAEAEDEELQEFEAWIKQNGLPIKGKAFKDGYNSYLEAVKGDLGEVVSVGDKADVDVGDDAVTCHIGIVGTKTFPDGSSRTATAEIIMTKGGTITSAVINVDRTFNEKIINAALNTVLGMGTTFCLLIFISIVIWLMGTIVQNMEKSKTEARKAAEHAVEAAARQIAEREEQSRKQSEETATDDKALIAVISAAIAAYESEARGVNVTPDTFIVRSLRRR